MKYIKTKDGIFRIKATPQNNAMYRGSQTYCIYDHIQMVDRDILEKEIIKQANIIEELCDAYVINGEFGIYIVYVEELDSHAMGQTKEELLSGQLKAYGAIWVIDSNGAPTLKSVAKANNKGELELL